MPNYISALASALTRSPGGAPAAGAYQPPAGGGTDAILQSIMNTPGAPVQKVPNFDDPSSWPQWLTNSMNQANSANTNQRNQVLSLLMGGGTAAKGDASQQFQNNVGSMNQDMISRGLNNTTAPLTAKMGLTRELNRQNQRIDENTADRSAGVIERMNNTGPDLGMFANLFSEAMRRPLYAGLGGALGYGGANAGGISSSPVANRSASVFSLTPGTAPMGVTQSSNGLGAMNYAQDANNFLLTGRKTKLSGLFQ